jgi:altronate hydrolase
MEGDQENTRTILADLINHPNAGGVLVLGLGCENSNIDVLKPYIGNMIHKESGLLLPSRKKMKLKPACSS